MNKKINIFIKNIWKDYKIGFIIFFIIIAIRTLAFNYYLIPSGSMYPNLKIGEHVFVNRLAYGLNNPFSEKSIINFKTPERGDIVVFNSPKGDIMIKRVVGLPGETIRIKDNDLYVNNEKALYLDSFNDFNNDNGFPLKDKQKLKEEIIKNVKYNILTIPTVDLESNKQYYSNNISWIDSTVIAKEGEIILIGDNRDNSLDSRFWGALPVENLIGKMIY